MKIKVRYGFHGRLRDVYDLTGDLIDQDEKWLLVMVDGKKNYISVSHILDYKEE